MKTRIAFALLLSAVLVSSPFFAHAQEMTKQDYLEKSRKQKTAGFILLGGGVAVVGIGAIVSATNAVGLTVSCIGLNCSQAAEEGIQTGGAIMLVGGLAIVGSIPLFVSAGNNRKKAAALSFSNEPIYLPKYAGNLPRAVPSITLKIRI
jgi:hypothetical protein